jgi:fumarate hydratase subunit beta
LNYIIEMILITPLKNRDVESLRVGDIVYVSGRLCTARDKAHQRALKKKSFPVDLSGGVLFHAGPAVKKAGKRWSVVAVGPTTSSRMNSFEPDFIKTFGVKAIVGKGGMDENVAKALKENKCVYLSMTGGCGATAASQIKRVVGVEWLDLGIPEAVWILDVENFGPLVVSMDSCGNSIYADVKETTKMNLTSLKAGL